MVKHTLLLMWDPYKIGFEPQVCEKQLRVASLHPADSGE